MKTASTFLLFVIAMLGIAQQVSAQVPVNITTQPSPQNVTAGSSATFSVVATGTTPMYQWQRNGANIVGAILSFNTIITTIPATGNVSSDDSTFYRCIVTGIVGTPDTSTAALLRVCMIPIVTREPSDLLVSVVGQTATFTVQARGAITSYQWQRNGIDIGSATGTTYSFITQSTDIGASVRCVVKGACGNDTTHIAHIFLLCFPVSILTNPQSDTVMSGDWATFVVGAIGTALRYQWEKSTDGTTWTLITPATNPTYGFNVTPADNGSRYRCRVSDSCGTVPATSAAAILTVKLPAETVILISPLNAANINSDSVFLKWFKTPHFVTKYHLVIATDSAMTFSIQDSSITDTSKIIRSLSNGQSYWWKVRAYNDFGWGNFSQINKFTYVTTQNIETPSEPFMFSCKGSTNIFHYSLPFHSKVSLMLFDVRGRLVSVLIDKIQCSGNYSISLPFSKLSKGVYIQVFKAGDFVKKESFILVR